ncbi:amidohydrolase [Corynebacterium aquilae]|uniref:N-acyl-L-amino acid amidohydrolase n=1 Tax=Corynebacterium aquilae DSM 44791 TaxID=1431546 RepID=A0A1L7CEE3_9CORY|nr:amidohydrolase [Corynebacterium aquilae]APT84143.1 N-acyl-L-amino acid amidohydrolase [Corynebacterium aquilae DSM 44791]
MSVKLTHAVDAWLVEHSDDVRSWFTHLHTHPELSHQEHNTTAFIVHTLRTHGMQPHLFNPTGAMVDIGPTPNTIPTFDQHAPAQTPGLNPTATPHHPHIVAFRGDIDALPMEEQTGLDYASTNPGVMHACGHDAHATIVLALACALKANEHLLTSPVRCIFQPAEEVMDGGAPDMIAQGALTDVASIFAVHAEPKLKTGQIGVKAGAITSAADVLSITVTGPGGHSSRPHMTADVVYALSKLVTELPGLLSRRVDPRTGTVLVFGHIEAGHAPNAIPEQGVVSGTIRTADMAVWRTIHPLLEDLIHQVIAPTGCRATINYQRGVPPVMNDDAATALLAEAARSIDPHCLMEASQSSGGEDFSWYLEHVPGSMARLGCHAGQGALHDLHRADLVVDPRAIGVGVRLFASIAQRLASD